MRTGLTAFLALICVTASAGRGFAQEFRIYTRVYDVGAAAETPNGKARLAATTLTLFHAGRVYDFIPASGEVIIFEPKKHEFTVLNTKRSIITVVHVDEIKRLTKAARDSIGKRIARLRAQGGEAANATADRLQFQLTPKFRKNFDRDKKSISLTSPFLRYDAKLKFVKLPQFAKAYREYADWVGRLNYVLHPRPLMPGPRRQLNAVLNANQALPVEVTLRVNIRPRIHLRAEHRIHWSLNQGDRGRLAQWNGQIRGRETRKVTLREYQRSLGSLSSR